MDGIHALPNRDFTACQYRNELTYFGLQPEKSLNLMGTLALMEAMVA